MIAPDLPPGYFAPSLVLSPSPPPPLWLCLTLGGQVTFFDGKPGFEMLDMQVRDWDGTTRVSYTLTPSALKLLLQAAAPFFSCCSFVCARRLQSLSTFDVACFVGIRGSFTRLFAKRDWTLRYSGQFLSSQCKYLNVVVVPIFNSAVREFRPNQILFVHFHGNQSPIIIEGNAPDILGSSVCQSYVTLQLSQKHCTNICAPPKRCLHAIRAVYTSWKFCKISREKSSCLGTSLSTAADGSFTCTIYRYRTTVPSQTR